MQVQDNIESIVFILAYLIIIWIFLLKVIIKNSNKHGFSSKPGHWKWIFLAYFLLGFGDLFHLGFRIYIFFAGLGPDEPFTNIAIGSGYVISGLTMTYFYIAIFHAWAKLYGVKYSTPSKVKSYFVVLYLAFILRIILMFLPYNRWFEGNATVDFGFDFRIITSIPIYIIGIISVYLLFKSSKGELKSPSGIGAGIDKANYKASIWFIISYASYTITLLFVAIYPLTGLFMIPKTIAYLVAFFYHYKHVLNQ